MRLARPLTLAAVSFVAAGCAGGAPLLHPAHTLDAGDVRAAAGLSANAAVGSLGSDLEAARSEASAMTGGSGARVDPTYAKGALVAAAVGPGIAPFIAARVGVGARTEGGISYTGRGGRIDMRHAFELDDDVALSIGAGVSGTFYGGEQGGTLPDVDLSALHGYGADVPLLVGWRSTNDLYMAWIGARVGYEHDAIEQLTSEPKDVTIGLPPTHLEADRYWGGGVVGVAAGFRHVHVAIEVDATYQSVHGSYAGTQATVNGVTLVPASAIWWSF